MNLNQRQRRGAARRSRDLARRLGRAAFDYEAALLAIRVLAASGQGSAEERLRRIVDYAESLLTQARG